MAFYPFGGRGFAQVTTATIGFRLPRIDTSVNLSASLLPTGPAYTAGADSFINGPMNIAGPRSQTHGRGGKYILTGTVHDPAGLPVSGAAVILGKDIVYSNSAGWFSSQQRKRSTVRLRVVPEQFVAPGRWRVVAAPSTATPDRTAEIIVDLLR